MGLVAEDDDIVALGVDGTGLVELVDEGEDVGVIFFEEAHQVLAAGGLGGVVAGSIDTSEGLHDLVIKFLAVGDHKEGEAARLLAEGFLAEESHGVGFAAPLGVPEHA